MALPAWIPARTGKLIEETQAALQGALGERLESVVLVGAAMSPVRHDRARWPEILAVVAPAALRDLLPLARALQGPTRAGARVRVLTRDDLEASCDVFTLEVAEWKARHHILSGRDPFESLRWTKDDMRRALEMNLRGLVRRLRNRVLTGLAAGPQRDDPHQAVLEGLDRLVVSAHHALELAGDSPPAGEGELLRALAARADADAGPLLEYVARIRGGQAKFDPVEAMSALLSVIEPAARWIDKLEVGA